MAFIKQTTLENGVSGNYWKIITMNINYFQNDATVCWGLFKDKAFRNEHWDQSEDKMKLLIKTFALNWQPDNFPFTKEALEVKSAVRIAYETARLHPANYFADAQDDI
jgi:hypothetical protein